MSVYSQEESTLKTFDEEDLGLIEKLVIKNFPKMRHTKASQRSAEKVRKSIDKDTIAWPPDFTSPTQHSPPKFMELTRLSAPTHRFPIYQKPHTFET